MRARAIPTPRSRRNPTGCNFQHDECGEAGADLYRASCAGRACDWSSGSVRTNRWLNSSSLLCSLVSLVPVVVPIRSNARVLDLRPAYAIGTLPSTSICHVREFRHNEFETILCTTTHPTHLLFVGEARAF